MKKLILLLVFTLAANSFSASSLELNKIVKDYSTEKSNKQYYAFYLIDGNFCTSCCINSVNLANSLLSNTFKNSLSNIIVFAKENKRNKSIAMQINNKEVFFDSEKNFESYFNNQDFDFPYLIITNNSGNILFTQNKLNNNPIEKEKLLSILNKKECNYSSLKEFKKIPVTEGIYPVNTFYTPNIINDSIFVFIGPSFNKLQFYNYNNGNFAKYDSLPKYLAYSFYDSTKYDISLWKSLDSMNIALSIREIVKYTDNSKIFKCHILKGYSMGKRPDGSDEARLIFDDVIIRKENNNFKIFNINLQNELVIGVKLNQSMNNFISLLDINWYLYEKDKSLFTKELPIVALFDSDFNFIKYLLQYKDVMPKGDNISGECIDFFTFSENGTLYLLSKMYSNFTSVSEDKVFKIKPEKTLEQWFVNKTNKIDIVEIIANDDIVVCIFSNPENNSFIFNIYNKDGKFINEINVPKQNLKFNQISTLAISDNTIILLIQDEEENWFINKYIFE